MPETNIGSAEATDLAGSFVDYSVDSEITDGATGQEVFRWQIEDWEKNLGYYLTIPELQTAIDAKANWTIGAGFEADEITQIILDNIRGNGKDSFNTIIQNCVRTYTIAGDSFCEIIRDPKTTMLLNLKPLDPSSMVIVQDSAGRIKRYEQVNKIKKVTGQFSPDQIFHLSRKRIADSAHGISVIPAVEQIILMRNEAMTDWKRVLHRNIDPRWIFHLDTDEPTEISAFKTKQDAAYGKGENMYIPKNTVEPELIATATNATLNPITWINQLNDYFFQAVNVPQIIVGNGKEFTDASGKITYLSYEQSVKGEQLYVEEQALNQLNVEIKLTFPASLQDELISDEAKGGPLEDAAEPNDTTAEIEGTT